MADGGEHGTRRPRFEHVFGGRAWVALPATAAAAGFGWLAWSGVAETFPRILTGGFGVLLGMIALGALMRVRVLVDAAGALRIRHSLAFLPGPERVLPRGAVDAVELEATSVSASASRLRATSHHLRIQIVVRARGERVFLFAGGADLGFTGPVQGAEDVVAVLRGHGGATMLDRAGALAVALDVPLRGTGSAFGPDAGRELRAAGGTGVAVRAPS